MNYIVLDLEWNQSNNGTEEETPNLLFEVIEIGAVKLNDKYVMIDECQDTLMVNKYVIKNFIGTIIAEITINKHAE